MKIIVPSGAAQRNCRRASAYPARSPQKRDNPVDTVAMKSVFHAQRPNIVRSNRSWKCWSVGWYVKNGFACTL